MLRFLPAGDSANRVLRSRLCGGSADPARQPLRGHRGERSAGRGGRRHRRGHATVREEGMTRSRPQIVAFGGGGFSMEAGNPLLDDYVLDLARERRDRPRVCFLPTASGDADHYIVRFYRTFGADRCEASHVSLFRRDGAAVRPGRASAPAGPDLRRRWQRHLAARDAARPRAGRRPARRLAVGCRDVRAERRVAVLVRRGRQRASTAATRGACPASGFLPCSNSVHHDAERGRDGAYRGFLTRRHAVRLRGRGRRSPALRRHAAGARRCVPAVGARLPHARLWRAGRPLAARRRAIWARKNPRRPDSW